MRRKLPHWLERIEFVVDRSIPYVLVLLAFLIFIEFSGLAEECKELLVNVDYFIIVFFIIDLCFKWYHTHDALKFIKLYWIDIIAVFPFYAIFRVYFTISELLAAGEPVQKILHESLLLRETKLIKAEYAAKFAKEARIVRVFARSLRVLRARWYVTHWHLQNVSKAYKKEHR